MQALKALVNLHIYASVPGPPLLNNTIRTKIKYHVLAYILPYFLYAYHTHIIYSLSFVDMQKLRGSSSPPTMVLFRRQSPFLSKQAAK